MLYLPRQPLETVEDLRTALGNAIAIELGTIPPYLTAYFSIKPGANAAAGAIIRSVVIEEMLHLSLACNLLNAVGGRPQLPAAVLRYPSQLPMGIGHEPRKPFIVSLARLSEATIKNFMIIEEPEHPLEFEDELLASTAAADYHTIGEFYTAVGDLMTDLVKRGEEVFTGARARQVDGWIGPHYLHRIDGLEGARKAIETIIDQGEGTSASPAADPGGARALLPVRADPAPQDAEPRPGRAGGIRVGRARRRPRGRRRLADDREPSARALA